jgi:hypothetical protein
MTFMFVLLAIAVGLSIGTLRALLHDGRPLRPPPSHVQDPRFVAPRYRGGQSWSLPIFVEPAVGHLRVAAGHPPAGAEILQLGTRGR